MSRIGKKIIAVPSGVTVEVKENTVFVRGPKGNLEQTVPDGVNIHIDGSNIEVRRNSDEKQVRSFHGLVRALLQNMITGVTKGFERRLEIQGVGYRAQASGAKITLNLGFSHPVEMAAPAGVTVQMDQEEKNQIIVSGANKQQVGEFAANLRKLRKPEPYKGKGIRYLGERVVRKAGKTAGAK